MRVTHSTSSTSETSACVEDEWQVQGSAALGSAGVPQQGLAWLSSDLGHCLTGCVLCLKDRIQEKATNHQPCQLLGVFLQKNEVRKFLILSPSLSVPSPSSGYKWGTGSWCKNTSLIALVRITIHPQVLPAENNTRTSNGEKQLQW